MAFSRASAFGYLRRAHTQGRLAHAYLITGPPGSGKRALAADLTQLTNGADADAVFTSAPPGVYVAEPESKSRRILIDQIRQLEQALQFRAVAGRKKLAIVIDADRLQPQAANAFLKTLEEPPQDSLLLLLSTLPEALPDTVLSRCVTITLSPVPVATPSSEEQELIELLATVAHENAGGVQLAYRLSQGFQRLLAHARNAIQEEASESLKREETRYKNTTDGTWLDDRDQHYKAFAESVYVQRRATLIETLLLWWGEILRAKTGIERSELPRARIVTAAISERLTAPEILRRIRRVEDLRDQLGRNIQEALAIEVAFLRVFSF